MIAGAVWAGTEAESAAAYVQLQEWEIPADFRGEVPPTRACRDVPCPIDLSGAEALEFELYAEDLSEFSWFLFHFWFGGSDHVGGGQLYPTEERTWQKIVVRCPEKKDARHDWSKVKGVRISGWRGGTNSTRLAVRNFRAVPSKATLNAEALAHLALTPPRPDERRLVWAHNPNGLRDVGWEPAIRLLAEYGTTDLIANLANGPSSAYPSKVLRHSARVKGKDRFAECLAACRKHGLKLHVWNVSWGGGWNLTKEEKAQFEKEGRYQISDSGKTSDRGWMCPNHPLTRRMLVESMLELAAKGADGIHFDYIRYPDGQYCFCGRCRAAFEKAYGQRVENWPRAIFGNDTKLVKAWRRFRAETITSIVRETATRLRATGSKCEISAAVFRDPLADPDFVGQDWATWCREGYLDFVCPMTYEDDFGCFRRKLVKQAAQVSGRVPRYPGIGLGVWTRDGLEVKRFADQVRYVRETGLKGFTVFDLSWKLEQLLPKVKSALDGKGPLPPPILERQALFPGFDGKYCKIQPSLSTDGKGTSFLTYQRLLLSGSDVFYGQFISRSADAGKTWSEPKELTALKDTYENGFRVARYANPYYLAKADRWVALGIAELFKDDRKPYQVSKNGEPYGWPLVMDVDPVRGEYTAYRKLDFPFKYELAFPFGQTVELENGDVLVPFYYRPIGGGHRGRCVVVRYRFDGRDLKVVAAGRPIVRDDLKRGVGEPSLVRFGKKIYMTLRSDEMGMWCASDDGLVFDTPCPWTWADDGAKIGNANTQQHWVKAGGRLHLAYTRVTPTNGHVFRNRAPVFLAEVDLARGGLRRETEIPIVPERGARLGNFFVTHTGDEAWLVTAEWMQPIGCEKFGSDNSLWFVRLGSGVRQ